MVRRFLSSLCPALVTAMVVAGGCAETREPVAAEAGAAAVATVSIEGMSCDGCAGHIATTVSGLDGVRGCDVSLEEGRATVRLADPEALPDVLAAIRDLGYVAHEGG